jgi:hypothetical protein
MKYKTAEEEVAALKAYRQRYYQQNREKKLKYRKEHYEQNKEEILRKQFIKKHYGNLNLSTSNEKNIPENIECQ